MGSVGQNFGMGGVGDVGQKNGMGFAYLKNCDYLFYLAYKTMKQTESKEAKKKNHIQQQKIICQGFIHL